MKDLSCDEVMERVPALVIGDLTPLEQQEISLHTAICAECAQEIDACCVLSETLDSLAESESIQARAVAALPGLRDRLLAALPGRAAYDRLDSPVGPLWVVVSERGLCRVAFGGTEEETVEWAGRVGMEPVRDPGAVRPYAEELDEYFAGRRRAFDLPVDLSAVSAFARRVLEATARIPFGRLASYRDIARAIGKPGATRAVGNALGDNPVPIIVPCHRIVRSNGAIGGYTGGLDIKWRLLTLEGASLPVGGQ
ncbi:MAG TPA: methylated-DNA--[protein]-cysteine S-methyltransferase [Thermomicrobiaceae bacterium]|nr:methylated-DNA--[protein]-cysteine S-methyltransferase [Thermomicrobiaceae bacterium]